MLVRDLVQISHFGPNVSLTLTHLVWNNKLPKTMSSFPLITHSHVTLNGLYLSHTCTSSTPKTRSVSILNTYWKDLVFFSPKSGNRMECWKSGKWKDFLVNHLLAQHNQCNWHLRVFSNTDIHMYVYIYKDNF